jgi:hypothetical protein
MEKDTLDYLPHIPVFIRQRNPAHDVMEMDGWVNLQRRLQKMTDFDPCGQKKWYRTKDEAWMDAARQNRESLGSIIKKPYKCKYCSGFHLTTLD